MPIIIDENQTQEDLQKQVATLTTQQVDMKFFSSTFTGSPKRKTGMFHALANTVIDSINQNSIDIYKNTIDHSRRAAQNDFNRFRASKASPDKTDVYTKHTNLQLLPVTMNQVKRASDLHNELVFDGASYALGINQIGTDGWTIVADNNNHHLAVKPFVSTMSIYGKHIEAKSSPTGVSQNYTQVAPELFVAIARYRKDITDIRNEKVSLVNEFDISSNNNEIAVIPITIGAGNVVKPNTKGTYDLDFTQTAVISNLNEPVLRNMAAIADSKLIDPIANASMTDMLNEQAQIVNNHSGDYMFDVIRAILTSTKNNNHKRTKDYVALNVADIVAEMENLSLFKNDLISTQELTNLYQLLRAHDSSLGNKHINNITRQSLRLLLSQRLHELDALQTNNALYQTPTPDPVITDKYQKSPNYSIQQKRIILTDKPLVIGQAGAGSGKSHTLIGRIKYLEESGEDLSKMLVLSFTNVAAQNINNRFPSVKSETLANMFNKIYQNTYPSQALSQPTTVANSLRLLDVHSPYFQKMTPKIDVNALASFKEKLALTLSALDQQGFKKVNIQEVTRDLSNMISEHLDFTTMLLDAVEQTTLELEPIIIHNALINDPDALSIPKEYQTLNYIVTDESQDISTFEYILLLELSIHYKAQLIIIGDGSQTLYEFRNSDPAYLNALEASNVFEAYKLDVNYRSSQEILSYANQFLDVIDANEIAQIQLTANNMKPISKSSFKQAVTVIDSPIVNGNVTETNQELESHFESETKITSWLLPKLQAGEQVAIMAWTRRELEAVERALKNIIEDNGLDVPITNIMSNNNRPLTLISDTIVYCKSDIYEAPTGNTTYLVKELRKILTTAVNQRYKKVSTAQGNYFKSVINQAIDFVTASPAWRSLCTSHQNGLIPSTSLIGYFTKGMLKYETTKNATEQFLRKNDEVPNYDNCKLIISTIHGAKGLEFQHSIVLFNERRKGATSQESMRMYFVALSRAKESELIINMHSPAQTNTRMFTSAQHAMFETPMHTAFLRVMDDITQRQQALTATP